MEFNSRHYRENGLLVADLGFRDEAIALREQMLAIFADACYF